MFLNKNIYIFLIVFFSSLLAEGQSMTIDQTLDYIKDKFRTMKKEYRFDKYSHERSYTDISLSPDGQITISSQDVRYIMNPSNIREDVGIKTYTFSFYPVDVTITKKEGSDYTGKSTGNGSLGRESILEIWVSCKHMRADGGDCATNSCLHLFWLNDSSCSHNLKFKDELLGESIFNALKYLTEKISADPKYPKREVPYDPFAPRPETHITEPNNTSPLEEGGKSNVVKMVKSKGGTYEIPVRINGVLAINFIFDSGASDVSISPDVALTLIRTGTLTDADYIGSEKYRFADGSTATSKVFLLKELLIGNKKVNKIRASISNSTDAPMLLGQSVLQRFGKFSIDNINHTITLD